MNPIPGEPLGPAGVAARMAEIQSKLNAKFGYAPAPTSSSFAGALQGQLSGGLSGAIGENGTAPLSPLGLTTKPVATAPPELQQMIDAAAAQHGVDSDVLTALVSQESGFSPTARSKVGAMGLTQLMPSTAASLGVSDPFNPAQSLQGGAAYLKQMLNKFGNLPDALAAYNAGPGAVEKYGGIPPYRETQNYVSKVIAGAEHRKGLKNGQ